MTEPRFTITLAQLNPTVGDVTGNAAKARAARAKARADGADVVVLSELFIAGYPPEDLILKPAFQAACRAAIEELARETADGGPAMLIGTPWVEDGKLYNACALLDEGRPAFVGLKPVDKTARLRAGAHFLPVGADATIKNDQGYMTSVAFSPSLDHWIGLGVIVRGPQRIGERVRAYDPVRNGDVEVEICDPVFVDREGARLHG